MYMYPKIYVNSYVSIVDRVGINFTLIYNCIMITLKNYLNNVMLIKVHVTFDLCCRNLAKIYSKNLFIRLNIIWLILICQSQASTINCIIHVCL